MCLPNINLSKLNVFDAKNKSRPNAGKNIIIFITFMNVFQLDLQNILGCAGTKPRQSIARSPKIISNNVENATEQLVEERNKFEAFQIRYNKSYLYAKEVSVLWFLHV